MRLRNLRFHKMRLRNMRFCNMRFHILRVRKMRFRTLLIPLSEIPWFAPFRKVRFREMVRP